MSGIEADVLTARRALEDRHAAEELLRRLYPKIVQVVHFVVRNGQSVDDLCQNAAVEIMKSLRNYQGTGSLEAWAGQIAYRVAQKGHQRHAQQQYMALPLLEDQVGDEPSQDESLSRFRLFTALMERVEEIPEMRRLPMLLHVFEGYTVSELAEMDGVTSNTVKGRLKTAYKELREILEAEPALYQAIVEALR